MTFLLSRHLAAMYSLPIPYHAKCRLFGGRLLTTYVTFYATDLTEFQNVACSI